MLLACIARLFRAPTAPQNGPARRSTFTPRLVSAVLTRLGGHCAPSNPPQPSAAAKLVFAGALKALGWVGAQEENVQWWTDKGFIGTKDWELIYDDEWGAPYVYLRMVAALAGSLLIPVVYLSTRALGAGRLPSAVAATLVLTETVSALQARLILCDAFLYLFHVASLGASFVSVAYPLSSARRWLWVGITGLMLGCAVSVKLTALGTLATVGIHQLIWVLTIADDG